MVGQRGFFDVDERLAGLSRAGDPLQRLAAVVDFELFRADLETALMRSDRARGGRPPYDAVLMFRLLVLQTHEQERRPILALDLHQELGPRRLDRDVKGGDRLVGDHHLGVAGKRPGDADPLLLPARELARAAVIEGARQLDQVQELEHAIAGS